MSQSGSEVYSPEFLESEYPKHLASPYKPKNFQPRSKLEVNDARIRDQLIKSNQEKTASRYRRFLQEIFKRKHHFLRDVAWPVPTILGYIPLARPLFLLEVTVAFEPSDLDFEIMSPKPCKSKTLQDPSVTFEAELIESKVRSIGAYVSAVPRRSVPTPQIVEHRGILLSLPYGLRAANFLLNEKNLKNVGVLALEEYTCDYKIPKYTTWQKVLVPNEEENEDFVARTQHLERVPPRSKKRIVQAGEASGSAKEPKRTETTAKKKKSSSHLTIEAAKSPEQATEVSAAGNEVSTVGMRSLLQRMPRSSSLATGILLCEAALRIWSKGVTNFCIRHFSSPMSPIIGHLSESKCSRLNFARSGNMGILLPKSGTIRWPSMLITTKSLRNWRLKPKRVNSIGRRTIYQIWSVNPDLDLSFLGDNAEAILAFSEKTRKEELEEEEKVEVEQEDPTKSSTM
uniref:Uncharacterized protein n=1 Tax=Cannabis sativa TaxID=3483 RepID=A0A803QCT8_CANSA